MPDLNNTDESIQNLGIPEISLAISANEGLTNAVDKTLTADGEAADAKTVGDKFDEITQDLIPDLAATLANAVLYEAEQSERTDAQKKQALDNISGVGTVSGQELTDAQKNNARTNIGAAGEGDAVMVTTGLNATGKQTVLENIGAVGVSAQSGWTDAQKKQALKNIGAVGVVEQAGATGYTAEEKTRARTNIGAIGSGEAVAVTTGLSAEQKTSVRSNIGAISEADAIALIDGMQPLGVKIEATESERYTVEDDRITGDHVVVNLTAVHGEDITWTTGTRSLTVSCASGLPGMYLMLCIPKNSSN